MTPNNPGRFVVVVGGGDFYALLEHLASFHAVHNMQLAEWALQEPPEPSSDLSPPEVVVVVRGRERVQRPPSTPPSTDCCLLVSSSIRRADNPY